ncbi:MAG: PIN domain-containing protein [Gaiellaceae bacterium]
MVESERDPAHRPLEELGDEEVTISVITVSELLHGVHRAEGIPRVQRRAFVEYLLASVEAVPITLPVARVHAEIWAQTKARGETIGAHDLWIAATALAYGLRLATRNIRDFGRVPGLSLLS